MTIRRRLSLWAPLLAYLALLHFAAGRSELPSIVAHVWDKLLHAAAYAVLAVLSVRAFQGGFRAPRRGAALAAGAFATAYGGLDEYYQMFVPGRSADPLDLLADAVGAFGAVGALFLLRRAFRPAPSE